MCVCVCLCVYVCVSGCVCVCARKLTFIFPSFHTTARTVGYHTVSLATEIKGGTLDYSKNVMKNMLTSC